MAERKLVYFVSDVHLGLRTVDPAEREARFIAFLKGLPAQEMRALYLLGDIWDFWYEYRDVIPREGARVVAALIGLMDAGVEVWFCPGNHDIWTYSYFEQLGMHRFEQPYYVTLDGKDFCLGHGDLLGGAKQQKNEKQEKLEGAMAAIRGKYGTGAIHFAQSGPGHGWDD